MVKPVDESKKKTKQDRRSEDEEAPIQDGRPVNSNNNNHEQRRTPATGDTNDLHNDATLDQNRNLNLQDSREKNVDDDKIARAEHDNLIREQPVQHRQPSISPVLSFGALSDGTDTNTANEPTSSEASASVSSIATTTKNDDGQFVVRLEEASKPSQDNGSDRSHHLHNNGRSNHITFGPVSPLITSTDRSRTSLIQQRQHDKSTYQVTDSRISFTADVEDEGSKKICHHNNKQHRSHQTLMFQTNNLDDDDDDDVEDEEDEDDFGASRPTQVDSCKTCCHDRRDTASQSHQSLVRSIGRRFSEIPHLFNRRISKSSTGATHMNRQQRYNNHNKRSYYRHHHRYDEQTSRELRRFSMQSGFQSLTTDSDKTADQSSLLQLSASQQPAPTTVAGVGGTITTVTRSKRKTAPLPRLVAKNGTVNLFLDNIDRRQYVRDLFTTMIDIKWRYNLMAAAMGFVFSWLFFACIWYSVLFVHNDLSHDNDPNWSPCIVNVNSFPAALLFSIETQSTLGFGSRIISVECPGAIVIFCIQLIFGVVVECLIVGMVFAKLTRPAKRSQTIMFSKYATVCLRGGKMCLTFRVGDVRSKSHIIGATIRASLVSQKITEEGEIIPFYHHQLDVAIDDSKNSLLLIWPVTIVHTIDDRSPFIQLNSDELASFKFEIITVLEGTVESTGQSIQVRSSYLPSEVKWGYRFEPIVSTHGCGLSAQTIIDYNKFNKVIEVDTPKCSPIDYYAQKQNDQHQVDDNNVDDEQQEQTNHRDLINNAVVTVAM